MHVLVQHGHDPDVVTREVTPVYKMALIAKEAPIDAELGRDGFRYNTVGCDLFEDYEQAGDGIYRLSRHPTCSRCNGKCHRGDGTPLPGCG